MNARKLLPLLILPLIFAAGCTTASLMNIVDRPVAIKVDGSQWSAEEVQAAIISACRNRGWIPQLAGESQVNCSISLRGRHYAEVEIPFSATRFSIIHSTSQGLDYDPSRQTIHRNFNRWIANLALEVQRELGKQ
jgi:hypothetical protein